MYGLQKYAKPTAEILQIPVLNYTKEDSRLSAQLELGAERSGTPVRRADAMIAATCISNEADIFTLDLKHFAPLKAFGLKIIR
jgi:tRNA(fMet)-specific endonuclease VapC